MEEQIQKILNDFFKKYDAPHEAIMGAMAAIMQLINNPMRAKYGAYVMTEAASRASDKKDTANSKPQGV